MVSQKEQASQRIDSRLTANHEAVPTAFVSLARACFEQLREGGTQRPKLATTADELAQAFYEGSVVVPGITPNKKHSALVFYGGERISYAPSESVVPRNTKERDAVRNVAGHIERMIHFAQESAVAKRQREYWSRGDVPGGKHHIIPLAVAEVKARFAAQMAEEAMYQDIARVDPNHRIPRDIARELAFELGVKTLSGEPVTEEWLDQTIAKIVSEQRKILPKNTVQAPSQKRENPSHSPIRVSRSASSVAPSVSEEKAVKRPKSSRAGSVALAGVSALPLVVSACASGTTVPVALTEIPPGTTPITSGSTETPIQITPSVEIPTISPTEVTGAPEAPYPIDSSHFNLNAGGSMEQTYDRLVALGVEPDMRAQRALLEAQLTRQGLSNTNYEYEYHIVEGKSWTMMVKDKTTGQYLVPALTVPGGNQIIASMNLFEYENRSVTEEFFTLIPLTNPDRYPNGRQQLMMDEETGWPIIGLFGESGTLLCWYRVVDPAHPTVDQWVNPDGSELPEIIPVCRKLDELFANPEQYTIEYTPDRLHEFSQSVIDAYNRGEIAAFDPEAVIFPNSYQIEFDQANELNRISYNNERGLDPNRPLNSLSDLYSRYGDTRPRKFGGYSIVLHPSLGEQLLMAQLQLQSDKQTVKVMIFIMGNPELMKNRIDVFHSSFTVKNDWYPVASYPNDCSSYNGTAIIAGCKLFSTDSINREDILSSMFISGNGDMLPEAEDIIFGASGK